MKKEVSGKALAAAADTHFIVIDPVSTVEQKRTYAKVEKE